MLHTVYVPDPDEQSGAPGLPPMPPMKGKDVRRKLAYAVRCLLINNYEHDREIGPFEFDWADEALMWIEWNTDRARGEALSQGIELLTDIPDGCQP
jgi:hypothetical protein